MVPLTTRVVTVGLTAETDTGVTRRTPAPMGTVRKMVPGCPGAPFRTTYEGKGKCSIAVKTGSVSLNYKWRRSGELRQTAILVFVYLKKKKKPVDSANNSV